MVRRAFAPSALNRKLLRDLWAMRTQALAIALVIAAGIAGAALLPFWAAVGAVAVLATDYSVFVERDAGDNPKKPT